MDNSRVLVVGDRIYDLRGRVVILSEDKWDSEATEGGFGNWLDDFLSDIPDDTEEEIIPPEIDPEEMEKHDEPESNHSVDPELEEYFRIRRNRSGSTDTHPLYPEESDK